MSRRPRLPRPSDTRCLPISSFQCPCSRFRTPPRGAVFSLKAGAKIQPFSFPPKIFFVFFRKVFRSALYSRMLRCKLFFLRGGKRAAKRPPGGVRGGFFGGRKGVFLLEFMYSAVVQQNTVFRDARRGKGKPGGGGLGYKTSARRRAAEATRSLQEWPCPCCWSRRKQLSSPCSSWKR